MSTYAKKDLKDLPEICVELRRMIIEMIYAAKSGHPGGSLSLVEILAQLFLRQMNHDPERADWPARDRVILSKGHGVPALYAALAYTGYFPREEISTLRRINSRLQGHPDRRVLPGLEASTGSLGQGLSIGIGHALAERFDKGHYHTYVILGDGELQEGQVWEAAMFAAGHALSNLTAIVDANKFQLDDAVETILNLDPLPDKWRGFGWAVREVDGHDVEELEEAFEWTRRIEDKPTLLLCRTTKGRGVSFMENDNEFHGSPPNEAQYREAIRELTPEGR